MSRGALAIVPLGRSLLGPLTELFTAIANDGDSRLFHPHPFTPAEAAARCDYEGNDEYYAVLYAGRIVAYGMLRGWDAGYEIPSLGIVVRAETRGRGIGKLLMQHLHAVARLRGASRVRLKVYEHNQAARRMYEGLGYRFEGREGDQLVGVLDLASR